MIGRELLSIKEFSRLTGIKQTTLRYYDDMGLFSPAHRGDNGYRYYSPQQITTISSINLLHELDMPLKQITQIEKNRNPANVKRVLGIKEDEIAAQLYRLEKSYNVIKTIRKNITVGLEADEDKVSVEVMAEQPIFIGALNDFGDSDYFGDAFVTFCGEAPERGIDLRLPVGGIFNSFDSFVSDEGKPTYFFSMDPVGSSKKPKGRYLVGYGRGYYGQTNGLTDRMAAYIKENEIETEGQVYLIYLHDELCIHDMHQYLMQASIKVK